MGSVAIEVTAGDEDVGTTVDESLEEGSAVLEDGEADVLWRVVAIEEGVTLDDLALDDEAAALDGEDGVPTSEEGSVFWLDDDTIMPVEEGNTGGESEVSNENVGKGREEMGVELGK